MTGAASLEREEIIVRVGARWRRAVLVNQIIATVLVLFFAVGMVAPMLAAVLALLAKMSTLWSLVVASVAALAMAAWTIAFNVRQYRRRCGAELTVFDDRVEIRRRDRCETVAYSDISVFRFEPDTDRLRLRWHDGGELDVLGVGLGAAAFAVMGPRFAPVMADRLRREIESGASVQFSEGAVRRGRTLGVGVVALALGGLMLVWIAVARAPELLLLAAVFLISGWQYAARGYATRGRGIAVCREGVRRAGAAGEPVVEWRDLQRVSLFPGGITLTSASGLTLRLGESAENFVALPDLLRAYHAAGTTWSGAIRFATIARAEVV